MLVSGASGSGKSEIHLSSDLEIVYYQSAGNSN